MKLSRSQKIMRFFTSKERFKLIQEESMLWGFTCKNCAQRTSFWEMGGIRYQSQGNPVIKYKCPKCQDGGMKKIDKTELS